MYHDVTNPCMSSHVLYGTVCFLGCVCTFAWYIQMFLYALCILMLRVIHSLVILLELHWFISSMYSFLPKPNHVITIRHCEFDPQYNIHYGCGVTDQYKNLYWDMLLTWLAKSTFNDPLQNAKFVIRHFQKCTHIYQNWVILVGWKLVFEWFKFSLKITQSCWLFMN